MTTYDTTYTITGDDNYSGQYEISDSGSAGTYLDFWVLGGANYGGTDYTDNVTGAEVFEFGNLQYKSFTVDSTTATDSGSTLDAYNPAGTLDTGNTFQTTATGTSADTLHFSFSDSGSGDTHHFLTDSGYMANHGTWTADNDAGDAAAAASAFPDATWDGYYTPSDINAINSNYINFLDSFSGSTATTVADAIAAAEAAGYTPSNLMSFEMDAKYSDSDTAPAPGDTTVPVADTFYEAYDTWTKAGSFTADNGGDKVALGFSVGSDHIALDDHAGNGLTESTFDAQFSVTSTTHLSANNNVVNDTTIALGDGSTWQVDLLGVDTHTLSGQTLTDYVWNNVVAHATV